MKRATIILMGASIAFGAIALLNGCQEMMEIAKPDAGDKITFTASTEDDNTPKTRTAYSGVVTNAKERIDWVVDDQIRIFSDKAADRYISTRHFADYKVTSVNENGEKSEAKIANAGQVLDENGIDPGHPTPSDPETDANGLVWGEDGDYAFCAIYPSPDINTKITSEITETGDKYNIVNLEVLGEQTYTLAEDGVTLQPDMDYAYLYAGVVTSPTAKVRLAFKPLYTAFQFYVDSKDDDTMTLKSFKLSSATKALCGTFTATVTPNGTSANSTVAFSGFSEATDDNKNITVSFGDEGVVITKGHPVCFTVFTLPQAYDDLSISLETAVGGRSLELKENDTFIPFAPLYKYNLTFLGVPGEGVYTLLHTATKSESDAEQITTITFEGDEVAIGGYKDYVVKSYRTSTQEGATRYPIKWKIYAENAAGEWVDHDSDEWPAWLSLSAYEGEGGINTRTYESVRFTITPTVETTVTENGDAHAMETLKASAEVGSDSAPRDLSLYDIYGNLYVDGENAVPSIKKAGSHTSNCYVINSPGYYCFPIVYGNALDQTRGVNGDNKAAYSKYRNANDGIISQPGILEDMSISASDCEAVIVWQDQVSSAGLIREDPEVISAPSGAGFSGSYIKFHISQDNILPGNALIALRKKDDKTILWSWHMWVTPTPHSANTDLFKIQDVKYRTEESTVFSTLATCQFLGCNLGWTAPLKFSIDASESARLKIVQAAGQPMETILEVSYRSGDLYNAEFAGGTYYQWGRKDPLLPSNGNATPSAASNRACYSPAGYDIVDDKVSINHSGLGLYVDEWIKMPYVFNTTMFNSVDRMSDLWNADNDPDYDFLSAFGTSSEGSAHARVSDVTNRPVRKTVYDPCPPGFSVPLGRAFTGFTSNGYSTDNGARSYGRKIAADPDAGTPYGLSFTSSATSDSYTLAFYATGCRDYRNSKVGVESARTTAYYHTSVRGYNYYAAVGMFFNCVSNMVRPIYESIATEGTNLRPIVEQDIDSKVDGTVTTTGQTHVELEY